MLTENKIRAAKPRPKPYKITDANRLYLLVTPAGGKLWRWSYGFDGKQKGMAFDAWPKVSLAEARLKRDEAIALLEDLRDPSIAKKLKKEDALEASRQTFERVARKWFDNARPQWASVHAADVIRSLERDVFPAIFRSRNSPPSRAQRPARDRSTRIDRDSQAHPPAHLRRLHLRHWAGNREGRSSRKTGRCPQAPSRRTPASDH